MDKRYNIYFAGELIDGFHLADVRDNLARLFRADEQMLNKLFSGKLQLLKKNCDEEKAEKFRSAMAAAGAHAVIRELGSAEPVTPTPASAEKKLTTAERVAALAGTTDDTDMSPAGTPETATDEPAQVSDAPQDGTLVLSPAGTEVLSANERAAPVTSDIDTSSLSVDESATHLAEALPPPPPAPDVSHLGMAEVGEPIPSLVEEKAPLDPDTSALILSPEGTDFGDCAAPPAAPPDLDLSSMDLAAEGSSLLDEAHRAKEPPPAPATDHITLQD